MGGAYLLRRRRDGSSATAAVRPPPAARPPPGLQLRNPTWVWTLGVRRRWDWEDEVAKGSRGGGGDVTGVTLKMPPRGCSDDIGWQHEFHGGGVSRLKKHLAGGKGAGYSEVIGCPSVSYDVKITIAQHLRQIRAEKRTHSQTTLQDDEGGSQDEHQLPSQAIDVHVTVQDPFEKDMQRALCESRAEAWARGESESKGPRWQLGRAVAKFWHHSRLAFNAANSPYYKPMVQEIQNLGKHVQPPTPKELAGVYLDAEVEELKIYIASFKKKWQKYGITLMCDGWSGTTKSSLLNFLVYCDRQVFYHKSVDASNHIHNHQYILQLME
ncbi:hypothetical protein Taro_048078 [Colocasia esculenta]|uniref:DUF659 domain-containing protein n=1 Tax=Colocasia esculenta TaxID=4460 RepID=A0A843X646_COLES|nr:hypothetical protein [Colocasia esculenta]